MFSFKMKISGGWEKRKAVSDGVSENTKFVNVLSFFIYFFFFFDF